MTCPNCGYENRDEASFCRVCGGELTPVATTGALAESDPPSAESAAPGVEPAHAEAPTESSVALADIAGSAASLAPLAVGAVLQDRYTITQVLSQDGAVTTYRARDARRCPDPACGFADNAPDALFCANCGRELTERGSVTLRAEAAAAASVETNDSRQETFSTEGRSYTVIPDAAPAAGKRGFLSGVTLTVGCRTDPGKERTLNEDSLFALSSAAYYQSVSKPTVGLFIVADGIGGSEVGELASRLAIQTTAEQLLGSVMATILGGANLSDETVRGLIGDAVQAANVQVHRLAIAKQNDMGTTLALALLLDDAAFIANIGDSRVYLFAEGKLQRLTRDHSLVADLVAEGKLQPDEIYTHPQRNVITRSLGAKEKEEIDLFPLEGGSLKFQPGARLVLCCDGLWEMVRDADIEEVLWQQPDPQGACEELVQLANAAGGVDNISVIVVNVETLHAR